MEPKSYRAALLVGLLGTLGIAALVKHLTMPPQDETMEFFAEEARAAKRY